MICITGSNGKTTTTLLTYHILKNAGLNVGLAGNVGKSFALQVAVNNFDYYVLELSSFQLDDMYADIRSKCTIETASGEGSKEKNKEKMVRLLKMNLGIEISESDELKTFYELGGDSLSAVLFSMHVEEAFTGGVNVLLLLKGKVRKYLFMFENMPNTIIL